MPAFFILLSVLVSGSGLCGMDNAAEQAENKQSQEQEDLRQSEVKDDVIIIANIDTSAELSISSEDLKAVFLGKKTAIDQCTVVIAIQKDGKSHENFLKKYIDKTPSQYKMYWKQRVFSGAGHFPKTFQTEKSLIDYVTRTKGTIGYISSRKKAEADKIRFVQVKEATKDAAHTKPEPYSESPSSGGSRINEEH